MNTNNQVLTGRFVNDVGNTQKESTPKKSTELEVACDAWVSVLKHFGINRNLMPTEQLVIARAVQREGLEFVLLGFAGAKAEPKNGDFDPAKYISLRRVLDPERFERFCNLGSQAEKAKATSCRRQENKEPEPEANPEKVKEIMQGIFKRIT